MTKSITHMALKELYLTHLPNHKMTMICHQRLGILLAILASRTTMLQPVRSPLKYPFPVSEPLYKASPRRAKLRLETGSESSGSGEGGAGRDNSLSGMELDCSAHSKLSASILHTILYKYAQITTHGN